MNCTKYPLLALILAALVAFGAVAQDEQPEAEETAAGETAAAADEEAPQPFFDSVDVRVVNVDVWVTDKKGNPITGLTRDDFEIYENKRPVPITNFYAVEGGQPVAGGIDPQTITAEELPTFDRSPVPLVPESQRLNLIIYVDNFNIRPFNRNRVFRRVREFLHDQVQTGDRVMLVTYDRSLHIRHPFTTDPGLIASATFELEKLTGFAVHRDSDRNDILRDIEEAEQIGEVWWRVKQYAESQFNDLSFTITALKDFVGTLSGLEGRKAILYVSDGLEMTVGEDLYYALNYRFNETSVLTEARDFDASKRFRELAHLANAGRVTFYTIDAAGLRVHSSASVRSAHGTVPGLDSHVDSIHISNLQSPLQFLAEETGGIAIINTNDVGTRLDRVASDFYNYYSLGYAPTHAGNGRFYNIEVKLKSDRKGKVVRHRGGYRDQSTYERMADSTTSSLRYNLASNPMDLELELGGERPHESHFLVPVKVTVPLERLVLVPQEDFYIARLKVFFSAMDEKGDTSDVQEVPLQLRIPSDKMEMLLQVRYPLVDTQLQMRRGGHRVAVALLDEIGATESYVTREVFVGSG